MRSGLYGYFYRQDKNPKSIFKGEKAKDLEIHELGDGLQNIIVLLYPVFTAEKPTRFFIEEPENNMHPGFQKK